MAFSTIKPYTNAKGVSHDAHFNANGKYIGSVKKLGTEPILLEHKEKKETKCDTPTKVFSTIQSYTNAKGVSHDAHFNANGKYIGSVKKLGTEPILLEKKEIKVKNVKKEKKERKVVEAVAVEYVDDRLIKQIIYLQLENQELRDKIQKLQVIN